MINSREDSSLDMSIQESLKQLATQLGHPLDRDVIDQLYQQARDLLNHIDPAPVTLARVAGTLLVYQVQDPGSEESQWFNDRIQACLDEEEVEELIESMHRTDGL